MTGALPDICVEVVYALPSGARLLTLMLPAAATVEDALSAAAREAAFADIDWRAGAVGIFGKIAQLHEPLRDGDRVEIYRGPAADAKAARRARLTRLTRKRTP